MEKTVVPGYQIPWVLFLALPQTGFVTPWKFLQLSEAVFPLCAVGCWYKHATSTGEEVKCSQSSPTPTPLSWCWCHYHHHHLLQVRQWHFPACRAKDGQRGERLLPLPLPTACLALNPPVSAPRCRLDAAGHYLAAVLRARWGFAHQGCLQRLLTQLKLLTAILLFIYLAAEDRNSRR